MGIRGIRAGQSHGGGEEGAHSGGGRGLRGARNERVRAMGRVRRARAAHSVDSRRRSVLEAPLMRALTAGEIVARVKANLGIPWRDTTYRDTFKFGGPGTEVTGIGTAMFCNL